MPQALPKDDPLFLMFLVNCEEETKTEGLILLGGGVTRNEHNLDYVLHNQNTRNHVCVSSSGLRSWSASRLVAFVDVDGTIFMLIVARFYRKATAGTYTLWQDTDRIFFFFLHISEPHTTIIRQIHKRNSAE